MRRRVPLHVVILAGGSGTRFWPLSRVKRPKQFLRLAGDRSLLQATWDRARTLAPAGRIWVVAPRGLAAAVRRELTGLRRDRVIVEPSPKDTAPAIALACATIAQHEPGAIAAVLPSDHAVRDGSAFKRAVATASDAARDGTLVCLGIAPDRPATGFGYLKVRSAPKAGAASRVMRFVEKPDAAQARRFLRTGRYLWNGGMFVWRVESFLNELARVAPQIHRAASAVLAGSPASWARAPKISIDYALMEKAARVAVVRVDAGWDDVGSWDAAARLAERRTVRRADRLFLGSEGSAVFGGRRLVALVDVPGIVVVDAADALLVVSRASSERMKSVVDLIRAAGRADVL